MATLRRLPLSWRHGSVLEMKKRGTAVRGKESRSSLSSSFWKLLQLSLSSLLFFVGALVLVIVVGATATTTTTTTSATSYHQYDQQQHHHNHQQQPAPPLVSLALQLRLPTLPEPGPGPREEPCNQRSAPSSAPPPRALWLWSRAVDSL